METVDAHVHLWDTDTLTYPWLASIPPLDRTHWVDDLRAAIRSLPITCSVFVQADCLPSQTIDEVEAVSAVSDAAAIAGIVAYAPMHLGPGAVDHLVRLQEYPLVRGVRLLLQDLPTGVMADGRLRQSLAMLPEMSMTFDICVRHHQLGAVVDMVRATPETTFVLDHLGKPQVDGGNDHREWWAHDLRALAALPNVFAKLSGLATERTSGAFEASSIRPYLDTAIEVFGPDRLMFGSDWPVVGLATTYAGWHTAVTQALGALTAAEQQLVLSGTATQVYRLAAA